MKRSELAILLLLALIALAILGCWYVNMKYNEGQRKYSTLQAKHYQLERDHAEQTKTLAASRLDTAETQQSLDETLSSKDALQKKFNTQQEEHTRLVADKKILQELYNSLSIQKEQIEQKEADYSRINNAYAAYIRYVHSKNRNAYVPADAGVSGPDGGW